MLKLFELREKILSDFWCEEQSNICRFLGIKERCELYMVNMRKKQVFNEQQQG